MYDRFQSFTVLITKIARNIKRIKTEEMKEFDLKGPHVSCIYYLYKENGLTATKLKEMCGEDKAAISRSIDFLEQNGFIYSLDDKKKKYNAVLRLTKKGESAGALLANKIDGVLEKASAGLTEENRKILYQSLYLISNNLDNLIDNNKNE